jgi:hypothetical protein
VNDTQITGKGQGKVDGRQEAEGRRSQPFVPRNSKLRPGGLLPSAYCPYSPCAHSSSVTNLFLEVSKTSIA